jgi:tripartite-type tricarboxylate transporter receptor subunit TctC
MNKSTWILFAVISTIFPMPWCVAQTTGPVYPTKPINMVIPFAAGVVVDIVGRLVGVALSEDLGQQFVANNRTGGGSAAGTEFVAKAPADGYTLLVTSSSIAHNPSRPKLPNDTLKGLAAVGLIGVTPGVLVVHPSVPARSVKELLDLMKAKPGQLNFGSGGVGASTHRAFELLQSMAGVSATHIPYKGIGPAVLDAAAGQVQIVIAGIPAAVGYIKQNRLRALAVSGARRSPTFPELPTIAEAGVPGYEYTTWYGMLVPADTSKTVISKLNQSTVKVLGATSLRDKLAQQGVEVESSTPEQFSARLKM